MISNESMIAIYDFELFPYALGDVLTWNIQTAIRCDQANKSTVDIYICLDEKKPSSIYQRELVNEDNYQLFFNELYNAFVTNPRLGNIYIYHQRNKLLAELEKLAPNCDEINLEMINDYLDMLETNKFNETGLLDKIYNILRNKMRGRKLIKNVIKRIIPTSFIRPVGDDILARQNKLHGYFTKYILSHKAINQFAVEKSYVPLLKPVAGCIPDIDELIEHRLKGMKIVPFHLRLRRLDAGYGGNHTYVRDSDFFEWYDFLNEASKKYPQVIFVALGRMQEKPLAILRLPNVISLRVYGMGLGHELTLMLRSHLFIGTSSGFATLANFSTIPYFITRMKAGYSCYAYDIPEGTTKLPFANENQKLVYEPETSALLMELLESGLGLSSSVSSIETLTSAQQQDSKLIDIEHWLSSRLNPANISSTTRRFYSDGPYSHGETAYLLLLHLEKIRKAYFDKNTSEAFVMLNRVEKNFPDLCYKIPQYLLLKGLLSAENEDTDSMQSCLQQIQDIESQNHGINVLKSYLDLKLKCQPDDSTFLLKLKNHMQSSAFDIVNNI